MSTGNQFQPIYFDFDSQTIRTSENGKIQQVASFLQTKSQSDHHRRIHRRARDVRNTTAASANAAPNPSGKP